MAGPLPPRRMSALQPTQFLFHLSLPWNRVHAVHGKCSLLGPSINQHYIQCQYLSGPDEVPSCVHPTIYTDTLKMPRALEIEYRLTKKFLELPKNYCRSNVVRQLCSCLGHCPLISKLFFSKIERKNCIN